MRVLITGGTGLVGRALSAHLAARGDSVRIFTRDADRARSPHPRIEFRPWDPASPDTWAADLEGIDAVVHLAGAGVMDARWTDARKRELAKSRVDSTRTLVAAIGKSASKPCVLVSASAIGVYGARRADEALDESSAVGSGFLAELCEKWESEAKNAESFGTRVAIARLGIVLAKEGGALAELVRPFRFFVGGSVGSGDQVVSFVHLDDVVHALAFAIGTDSLRGALNVTAPNPVTMRELASEIGKAMSRPSIFRVPSFALRAALGERADAILTGQRVLPAALLAHGFEFRFPDARSALRDLLA